MTDTQQSPPELRPPQKPADNEIFLIDLFASSAAARRFTLVALTGVAAFSVLSLALPPETSPSPTNISSGVYVHFGIKFSILA
jgi:hypothetical protein